MLCSVQTPRWGKDRRGFWGIHQQGDTWFQRALDASLEKGFPSDLDGKESAYNVADPGGIPGSGRSPEERNGSPLQYSCLENFMDRRSLEGYSPQSCKESDTTEKNLIYNLSNYNRYISIYRSNNPQSTGASEALCCVRRLTRSPCLLSLHNFSRH